MFTVTVEQQVDPSTTELGVPDADDSLVLVLNVFLVSGPLVCNANIVPQTCVVWEIY